MSADELAALGRAKALSNLRQLVFEVVAMAAVAKLLAAPVASRVEVLEIAFGPETTLALRIERARAVLTIARATSVARRAALVVDATELIAALPTRVTELQLAVPARFEQLADLHAAAKRRGVTCV